MTILHNSTLSPLTLSILKWLAAGLGSGWLPKAPGTWGSLFSLIPAWFILQTWGIHGLGLATLYVTVIGFIVCYYLLPHLVAQGENHDPGWIVIDEWAGQWLCIYIILLFYPQLDLNMLLPFAFVLFRSFDILKPSPIKTVETWGADWFSIINDDLIAGIMGAALGLFILAWVI